MEVEGLIVSQLQGDRGLKPKSHLQSQHKPLVTNRNHLVKRQLYLYYCPLISSLHNPECCPPGQTSSIHQSLKCSLAQLHTQFPAKVLASFFHRLCVPRHHSFHYSCRTQAVSKQKIWLPYSKKLDCHNSKGYTLNCLPTASRRGGRQELLSCAGWLLHEPALPGRGPTRSLAVIGHSTS